MSCIGPLVWVVLWSGTGLGGTLLGYGLALLRGPRSGGVRVGDRVRLRGGLSGVVDEIRPEGYEDIGGRLARELVVVALDEGGFQGVPSSWIEPPARRGD